MGHNKEVIEKIGATARHSHQQAWGTHMFFRHPPATAGDAIV
jgi:hypothetical protein